MKPYMQNNYDFAISNQVDQNTAQNQARFKNHNRGQSLEAIEEEVDKVDSLTENEARIGNALNNPQRNRRVSWAVWEVLGEQFYGITMGDQDDNKR